MNMPRFWREIQGRYNLSGSRCENCGKYFFPKRDICPECHRKSIGKMKSVEFAGTGKVISYSIVHEPHPAYSDMRPYVMAIIELDEGPRLTSQIVDCEPEDVHAGMRVRATFRKLAEDGKEGVIFYGYKFRPE